jgi:hypothetical protein
MPSRSIPAVEVFFIAPPPDSCLLRFDHSLVMFHEGRKSYIAYNQLLIGILHFFCCNFNLHQTPC